MPSAPTVLHLPTAAMPWVIGGRESYSRALADQLQRLGWVNHLAFHQNPEHGEPLGIHSTDTGPVIHVLPGFGPVSRADVYGCRTAATPGYEELLDSIRPNVVHLHDFSSGVNLHHLEQAKQRGIKTVLTYHSPGQSCLERELLYNGTTVCDGEIRIDRCTACRLGVQGIPAWLRWPLANVSLPLAGESRLARAFTARSMTQRFAQAWSQMVSQVDRIHIHAEWVRQVMARNSVPSEKIAFIRLGLPLEPTPGPTHPARRPGELLKLVMVGRCERIKGQAVLIEAAKGIPTGVQVAFIGPYWNSTPYGRECLSQIADDPRFVSPRQVPHAEIPRVLGEADALVVPSLWLETGPLVVLEAFASGIPVLGSNLGGIAELVKDGENGLLFKPNSALELRAHIRKLIEEPETYVRLRRGIPVPRTMKQVATEMAELYDELLRVEKPSSRIK